MARHEREVGRALAELRKYRSGPLYTPPSLEGTVVMPGSIGGSGWGGGAFDPETGILYVKATNSPSLFTLRKVEQRSDTLQAEYMVDLARSSVSIRTDALTDSLGLPRGSSLPLNKPPYGTLTAIDLGDMAWMPTLSADTQAVLAEPAARFEPFPLTDVQSAYLLGRRDDTHRVIAGLDVLVSSSSSGEPARSSTGREPAGRCAPPGSRRAASRGREPRARGAGGPSA